MFSKKTPKFPNSPILGIFPKMLEIRVLGQNGHFWEFSEFSEFTEFSEFSEFSEFGFFGKWCIFRILWKTMFFEKSGKNYIFEKTIFLLFLCFSKKSKNGVF